jgi:hypothetical protein
MAFNPTSAREQALEDLRGLRVAKAQKNGPVQTFRCHWCDRTLVTPFRPILDDESGGLRHLAHAPDPWVTIKNVDCCPDCFESEIPPRAGE